MFSSIESEVHVSVFPKNSPFDIEKHGLSSYLQHGFPLVLFVVECCELVGKFWEKNQSLETKKHLRFES